MEYKFAEAIVNNCIQMSTYKYCVFCLSGDHDENNNIVHDKGCIVHDAIAFVNSNRPYDPNFGDDRVCVCGHTYYRHFDSWENMYPCGCKYCRCDEFKEAE